MAYLGSALDFVQRDFGWNHSHSGMAFTIQALACLAGTVFMTQATKKYSEHLLLSLSSLLFALGCFIYFSGGTWHLLAPTEHVSMALTPFIASSIIGFAFGANILLHNSLALKRSARALNFIQMGFTAGAVIWPFLGGLPALQSSHLSWQWRIPGFLVALGYLMLGGLFFVKGHRHSKKFLKKHSETIALQKQNEVDAPLTFWAAWPQFAAGFALFCYIGLEICLSTWVTAYALQNSQIISHMARQANGYLWLGLFAVRVIFAFHTPQQKKVEMWLIVFAASTMAFIAIFLKNGHLLFPYFQEQIWLLNLFLIGLSMGGMYSFIMNSAYSFYTESTAQKASSRVMLIGESGAVVMPAIFGMVAQSWGVSQAMWVLLLLLSGQMIASGTLYGLKLKEKLV